MQELRQELTPEERNRAYRRAYFQKHKKEIYRKNRELHYDEYTQKWKQYANAHKDEIHERQRKYYATSPRS